MPTESHMSNTGAAIKPYIQLCRLDKPTGIINIALPYLLGLLYAACATDAPMRLVTWRIACLVASAVFLRSAGCAWNDIVDRDLDKKVERCRNRPMARGALTMSDAVIFTACLTVCYLSLFRSLLERSVVYTTVLTAMVVYYPYAKRSTNLAQVVLGLTLSWGILIGAATCGLDVLHGSVSSHHYTGIAALFAAYTVWCMIHDTVYAQQDIQDDVKAGVKSMAVLFQNRLTSLLLILTGVQVFLLACVGSTLRAHFVYYIWACFGTCLLMVLVLINLNPADAQNCGKLFRQSSAAFACCTLSGFASQYLLSN